MTEAPSTTETTATPATGETPKPPAELPGDHPLVKTLAAQKAELKELKAAKARLDELEQANATDLERAVKKAREEGATEAAERANGRLRNAEARALAAELRFRNPAKAVRLVDLDDVTVSPDGTVDAAAIKARLDSLAKDEPYLVDDGKGRPKPDDAQGQSQGTPSKAAEGLAEARKRFGTPAGQQ
jgi:alanyl-tRNA synthetase